LTSFLNKIFNKKIKIPTYFIAEIGVNHNGNLLLAKKMIDSAKKSGANAVKFQTFKAERLATPNTPKVYYQKKFSPSKQSHLEMLKSLELSDYDHIDIKKYCKIKKIDFISTPYDLTSAIFLSKIGCKYFKTSSADIVDLELHDYLAKNKKSVIISTGMSNEKEIEECLKIYKKYSNDKVILLHCVSNYPCSLKSLNMNVLPKMKKKFGFIVGYSDHTIGHEASVVSVALGAKVIEKHFTISKKLSGPDQNASSLPNEFKKIVSEVKKIEIIMGNNIKKCQKEEVQMRKVSRKSLTINKSLKKGEVIKLKHLCLKRPGTGIFYSQINKIIGKKTKKKLKKNYQIKFRDVN
jgi:N,N'-diacetyllegionaminate synthase